MCRPHISAYRSRFERRCWGLMYVEAHALPEQNPGDCAQSTYHTAFDSNESMNVPSSQLALFLSTWENYAASMRLRDARFS